VPLRRKTPRRRFPAARAAAEAAVAAIDSDPCTVHRELKLTLYAAVRLILLVPSIALATMQETSNTTLEDAKSVLARFIEFNKQSALQSQEARNLLAGEASLWKVPSFGKLAAKPDAFILLDATNAVGRVQWFGERDFVADLYFYLRFEENWKIYAMRRLALTGIIEDVYRYLRDKKGRTAEEESQLRNYEIVLATDAELRAWFEKNGAALQELAELGASLPKSQVVTTGEEDSAFPELKKLLKKLDLSTLELNVDGNVEITIGGVTDNTVGFIFSPANRPPAIDPSSYIWVEKLTDKWFLFRTT
jgi:hypothetical protein